MKHSHENSGLPKNSGLPTRIALVLVVGLSAACTKMPENHVDGQIYDPDETWNRQYYNPESGLDRNVVEPVTKGYSHVMPDAFEMAIGNFSDNLSTPSDVVNNLLQANLRGAVSDTGRFLINSTFGVLGFYDAASEMGLPAATDTDFGETLYVWGVPQGAYQHMPIIGSTTERDTAGHIVDLFTNPLSYVIPAPESYYGTAAKAAQLASDRANDVDRYVPVLEPGVDNYAEERAFYARKRRKELGIDE